MTNFESLKKLPVFDFLGKISMNEDQLLVVKGDTGSGKTVLIPAMYVQLGYKVLVVEPLRETCIGTAEHVANVMGVELGGLVGYRVGDDRCDSKETKLLFCTDALALERELRGQNRWFDILIIDEIHQWTVSQTALEAVVWHNIELGVSTYEKMVLLSADFDIEDYSWKRDYPEVIDVPGRQYPIEVRKPKGEIDIEIRGCVQEDYDVLCFLPGVKEIKSVIKKLKGVRAEIVPFYSGLSREEKDRAYRSYKKPKVILSTNALETGRTVMPSKGRILVVVDGGKEKQMQSSGFVDRLVIQMICKAQSLQRKGRTGRVGPGIYINFADTDKQDEYLTPEILRTRINRVVLSLLVAGYDPERLEFAHDLPSLAVSDAKKVLYNLGALDENKKATDIGKRMNLIPGPVRLARMMVEGEKRGVASELATIVSVLMSGSLKYRDQPWKDHVHYMDNDYLAELELYEIASELLPRDMKRVGIHAGTYFRARNQRREIMRRLNINDESTGTKEDILASVSAGMVDLIFKYSNELFGGKKLSFDSVASRGAAYLYGVPLDIVSEKGYVTHLLTCAGEVDFDVMMEIAPHLVRNEYGINKRYDIYRGGYVVSNVTYFNGHEVREEVVDYEEPVVDTVINTSSFQESFSGIELDARVETAKTEVKVFVESRDDYEFPEPNKKEVECQCGRFIRMTKGELKKYKSGERVELKCGFCATKGFLQREVDEMEEVVIVEEKEKAVDLSGLMAAWG